MYNFFAFVFLLTLVTPATTSPEVEFYNIKEAKGTLRLAVFENEEHFTARSPAVLEKAISINSTANIKVQIPALTAGKTYSIAAFHDLNNNGELDTNMFGIPTEPYAFSNNPKIKWKAPVFAETAFKAGEGDRMRLRLAAWSEQ
jgi:uncharacterized protein (DUF2141 family)